MVLFSCNRLCACRNIPQPNKNPSTVVLSTLSYIAIEDVIGQVQGALSTSDVVNLKRRFKNTSRFYPKELLKPSHEKIVFACKLR